MASSEEADLLAFQKFKTEDGSPLNSLRTHICAETEEQYLLWTDVQCAFQGIDHLKTDGDTRGFFTIDANGELYVLLLEKQSSYLL